MEEDGASGSEGGDRETDPTEFCPSCGERGTWQKCKLICTNQRCSVRIILACVD